MKDEDRCKNIANIRRFWPGREPDLVCAAHAADSRRILEAIGTYLHTEPFGVHVDEDPPDPWPTCCCSKGFSQTITLPGQPTEEES